jgi:hypothetical protein
MMRMLSQGDAGASPPFAAVRLLYRHALESIFAFSSLTELAAVFRVSKGWSAAVHSMRPLDGQVGYMGSIQPSVLQLLWSSRLARHVGSLSNLWPIDAPPLSDAALVEVAQRMVNLRSLSWKVGVAGAAVSLVFPARLRELRLNFVPANTETPPSDSSLSRALTAAIGIVVALPELESLALTAHDARSCDHAAAVRTGIARAGARLEPDCAGVTNRRRATAVHATSTFAQLPSVGGELRTNASDATHDATRHTRCAVAFHCRIRAAIVSLPSLTKIDVSLSSTLTDSLRSLPNLRSLRFSTHACTELADADRILSSLHSLVGLTELRLYGGGTFPLPFTSAQLAACLPHMPLLTHLYLLNYLSLDSLRFLSSGPITHSLKELSLILYQVQLPLSELAHVHALSSLTKLTLWSVFDPPPDESTVALYTPPSRLMPSLQSFWHRSDH